MKLANIDTLLSLHSILNIMLFKGSLKDIKICFISKEDCITTFKYKGKKRILGFYDSTLKEINFCIEVILDDKELVETLIHEMIHQYQYEYNCKDLNHGNDFQKLRRKFKRRINLDV